MVKKQEIKPYIGIDDIKLYSSLDEVISYLDNNNIKYEKSTWSVEGETIPDPWTILEINNTMKIAFAKNNKCFEIVALEDYKGKLPNDICIGMNLDEALKLDKTISFEEFEEYYSSKKGYWFEDDLTTGKIISITIYIKEINDKDFDECKW